MRDLDQYRPSEWLKARPLVAALKDVRDATVRDLYCARGSSALDPFLEKNSGLAGANVAVTIAFEQAWLVRHMAARFRRYCDDATLIVLDNSRSEAGRRGIAAACQGFEVPYLRLPASPVRRMERSHGNALNWAYRNVIVKLGPKRFGFFDHDLFLFRRFSMHEMLAGQAFYGLKQDGGYGWALWAGYCMFDLAFMRSQKPDFNPDKDRRLLPGGRNYRILSRAAAPELRFATRSRRYLAIQSSDEPLRSDIIDGWFHIGGSSWRSEKLDARSFYENLLEGDRLESGIA